MTVRPYGMRIPPNKALDKVRQWHASDVCASMRPASGAGAGRRIGKGTGPLPSGWMKKGGTA